MTTQTKKAAPKKTKAQDYTAGITVNATAQEAFNSINNVTKWWTRDFKGSSQKLNDVFTVSFGPTYITLKIVESVPGKRIVWYVTDCNKHWLKNKKEWKDTQVVWEISSKGKTTQIDFTHQGLVPQLECYGACENAWSQYIKHSLLSLINTGKGQAG